MPKVIRLTAKEAESMVIKAGFSLNRSQESHRIYKRGSERLVIPFHGDRVLHPKIVKQILAVLPSQN